MLVLLRSHALCNRRLALLRVRWCVDASGIATSSGLSAGCREYLPHLPSADELALPGSGRAGVLPPTAGAAADGHRGPALPVGGVLAVLLGAVEHPERHGNGLWRQMGHKRPQVDVDVHGAHKASQRLHMLCSTDSSEPVRQATLSEAPTAKPIVDSQW